MYKETCSYWSFKYFKTFRFTKIWAR